MRGSHRPAGGSVNVLTEVVPDGFKMKVPLMMLDSVQRAITQTVMADSGNALDLHKPGYRVLSDGAGRQAIADAYRESVFTLSNAWKKGATAELKPASDPRRPLTFSGGDSADLRKQVYQDIITRLQNAWKAAAPAVSCFAARHARLQDRLDQELG
jgi:hypothetical protein